MLYRFLLRIAAVSLLALITVPHISIAKPLREPSRLGEVYKDDGTSFEKDSLSIYTKSGTSHHFNIELATSYSQHSKGLMFRREMPQNAGMLFIFPELKIANMWMKNTYIPLDMLFIDDEGIITGIEHDTTPESLRSISSGVPIRSVLELNAGTSKSLGITKGDRVIYKAFQKEEE